MKDNPGSFKKGYDSRRNYKGRQKESRIIYTEENIRKALSDAKQKHNDVDLLTHLVNKAYTDTKIAIAILKKILPDLTHLEVLDPLRNGEWGAMTPAEACKKMDQSTVPFKPEANENLSDS